MITLSKENMTLYFPLSFNSSLLFVIEGILISEQIAERRFGSLLEINDTISFRLNVFSYMI